MNAMRIISPRVSPNVTAPYYHGSVVHVRTDGEAPSRSCEPSELAAEGGTVTVHADTLISRTAEGPFAPVATALERDAPLRDEVVKAIPVPSLTAWSTARYVVLALAAVPLLMLVELDRELVAKDLLGTGRLLVDLLLAAYVAFELTRRSPRMPAVAGAAMLAVSMRWFLVATRSCGKGVHPAVWAAAALSVGTAFAILARAPSRGRVALELLAKLGITRTQANAVKAKEVAVPSGALVVAAAAAAAGLPLVLYVLRKSGAGVWIQAAAFAAYAVVVPAIVLHRDARHVAQRSAGDTRTTVVRTLFAIALGLVLTASLLHGAHQFFDAGGELARCTGRLDEATRRLLAAEATELSRRVASVRASTALVLMMTAVMPLAEERIYRGLLMNVLVRKYGFTYGLFASAAAFGVAHVGVYELALYQTVLLGIGFGLAYAEGGLVAAFVVHAVWNLLNVA
ncbi:MAG: protease family protein [Myxococcales bacterium]|nr:protease family protein [Myxococcales bacterium]